MHHMHTHCIHDIHDIHDKHVIHDIHYIHYIHYTHDIHYIHYIQCADEIQYIHCIHYMNMSIIVCGRAGDRRQHAGDRVYTHIYVYIYVYVFPFCTSLLCLFFVLHTVCCCFPVIIFGFSLVFFVTSMFVAQT